MGRKILINPNGLIVFVFDMDCTPRHMPAKVIAVPDVPYTINGKKVELAVKKVIEGKEVLNKDALRNPEALDGYKDIEQLNS